MNKKAIILLGVMFLLIVGTLGFLIWQKNKSSGSTTQPTGTQPSPATTLPDSPILSGTNTPSTVGTQTVPKDEPVLAPPSGAVQLTNEEVIGAVLFYRGNSIAYLNPAGAFYQSAIKNLGGTVSLGSTREVMVEKRGGISKVLWPTGGNAFIAEFVDNENKKSYAYFNGDTGKYTDLPLQITSLQWLPGGTKIIYVFQSSDGKATLSTANPDSSGYKNLVTLLDPDVEIKASPNGQGLLFYRIRNYGQDNKIVYVTSDGKLFKTVIKDGYNLGVSWAPDSRHFVFGKKNASGDFVLWLGDTAGDPPVSLDMVATPDKATWAQDSSYVMVAGKAVAGRTKATVETVRKIDITTLSSEEFDVGEGVDARELFMTLKEDKLFFKNYNGGQLYYIDIGPGITNPAPTTTTPAPTTIPGTATQPATQTGTQTTPRTNLRSGP
ncbi:MAG TPA: hypothetical protein VEA59_06060 [Patescibacteria group bacterium]|nr:hypothetical protein [Patescibacteria group bacterium]